MLSLELPITRLRCLEVYLSRPLSEEGLDSGPHFYHVRWFYLQGLQGYQAIWQFFSFKESLELSYHHVEQPLIGYDCFLVSVHSLPMVVLRQVLKILLVYLTEISFHSGYISYRVNLTCY